MKPSIAIVIVFSIICFGKLCTLHADAGQAIAATPKKLTPEAIKAAKQNMKLLTDKISSFPQLLKVLGLEDYDIKNTFAVCENDVCSGSFDLSGETMLTSFETHSEGTNIVTKLRSVEFEGVKWP